MVVVLLVLEGYVGHIALVFQQYLILTLMMEVVQALLHQQLQD
jgi:hypothetical protein